MSKNKSKMNDIVDLDKNKITLEDIEFISRDEMSQNEYTIKFTKELYSDIFLRLTHRYFSNEVARLFWSKIIKHRDELIIRLKRDPGLLVSCLDYLTNIENILIDATIIEEGKSQYIITTNLIDNMTGLFIRGVFDVVIKKETDFSVRTNAPLALMMIDLDDFKEVNDNFGHQAGDNVLSVIGSLILESIRKMDIACRYGGEELAVIMPSTDLSSSKIIAERIRKKIEQYKFNGFKVTASIGLSIFESDAYDTTDLVSLADIALYKAKMNGKNRVVTNGEKLSYKENNMDKIKIELRFDDKTEVKSLSVFYCEFEQLIHNKEIISDGNEYQIIKSTAINVGDDLWYCFDCKLKGGLRSQSSVYK